MVDVVKVKETIINFHYFVVKKVVVEHGKS